LVSALSSSAFLPSVTFDKEFNLSGGCIVKASHSRSICSRVAKIAWRPALFVLLAVLCFPLLSHAQDTGYIGGTVIDKSGAAIAGAEITLKNWQAALPAAPSPTATAPT